MALTDTAIESTVERLEIEPVARVARLQTVPPTPKPTPQRIEPQADDAQLGVYRAIASVLAASAAVLATRVILLLGLVGVFVLAVIAAESASWLTVAVLVAYAILVLIPLVLLETRTHWPKG